MMLHKIFQEMLPHTVCSSHVGIIRCTCNAGDLSLVYGNFKCYIFHFNSYVDMSIEILVNETTTTRTQFCVGEMLTLVCRHYTSIHAWEVPPSMTGIDLLVTGGFPTNSVNNINATHGSNTRLL